MRTSVVATKTSRHVEAQHETEPAQRTVVSDEQGNDIRTRKSFPYCDDCAVRFAGSDSVWSSVRKHMSASTYTTCVIRYCVFSPLSRTAYTQRTLSYFFFLFSFHPQSNAFQLLNRLNTENSRNRDVIHSFEMCNVTPKNWEFREMFTGKMKPILLDTQTKRFGFGYARIVKFAVLLLLVLPAVPHPPASHRTRTVRCLWLHTAHPSQSVVSTIYTSTSLCWAV